jgi:trk system potassium uptake protein TrkA
LASNVSPSSDSVVVIGLGRFGGQVADSLIRLGHEVLGIDESAKIVAEWSEKLTHVVQADATDDDALRQLGVHEFARAIVFIGCELVWLFVLVMALK